MHCGRSLLFDDLLTDRYLSGNTSTFSTALAFVRYSTSLEGGLEFQPALRDPDPPAAETSATAMESAQKEPKNLIGAATWGEVNYLEGCLQNGADPNEKDEQGDTPLHVACYYGELECASVLLSYKGSSSM